MQLPHAISAALVLTVGLVPAAATAALWEQIERTMYEATVAIGPDCSGVLAGEPGVVLTTARCVRPPGAPDTDDPVEVTLANGEHATAWVAAVDRVTDQALLVLDEPVAITPLPLAPRRPIAGTVLYFTGNPRTARFREVKLQHVGRWPSLPMLQSALFTSIVGAPGDIGAPIVNTAGRVVGLIQGGSRFEVATPTLGLRRLVKRLLGDEALSSRPAD